MTNRRLMKKVAGMSYVSPAWLAVATAAFVAGCGGGEGGNPQMPNEARLQVARSGDLVAYFKAKIAQRVALGYPGTAITVPTVGGLSSAGSVVTHTGRSWQVRWWRKTVSSRPRAPCCTACTAPTPPTPAASRRA